MAGKHDAHLQEWQALLAQGWGTRRIAKEYDTTRDVVKNALFRAGIGKGIADTVEVEKTNSGVGKTGENEIAVEFPELKSPPQPGWAGDFLAAVIRAQEEMEEHDTTQARAPITVKEELPFGMVFSGDWHLGGRGTDHRLLQEYLTLWRRAPGLGVLGMGDYTEMFVGKMAQIGVNEHVVTPDMQLAAACDMIETELAGKLLGLLKGNHDAWAGANLSNYVLKLAQRMQVPFLGLGGEVLLTVGRMAYRLACWHRYPGAGAVNRGNNQRRASNDHRGPDVTALAHLHYLFVEMSKYGEQDEIRLRSGALKVTDEHARDVSGNVVADVRMPMVVFHPTENRKFFFPDFRDGIEPLLFWRRRWHQYPSWSTDVAHLERLLSQ